MAVTVALAADPTPYTLQYLATHDGVADGNTVAIPNAGGATPDLQTDNLNRAAWLTTAGGYPASSHLADLINANRAGLGSIVAGAMTQAEARALFSSDDRCALLSRRSESLYLPCILSITALLTHNPTGAVPSPHALNNCLDNTIYDLARSRLPFTINIRESTSAAQA